MNQIIKKIIKITPLYRPLCNWVVKKKFEKELVQWERNGKPVPPPHLVKQRTLRAYSERFGLKILIETGTFYGDMVEAMKDVFDRIYSIELSKELYEKAKERFIRVRHIEIIYGDSGIELKNIISKLDQPALFWLDGHYSAGETAKGNKETPIYEELNHILNSTDRSHVIIIDDAQCFGKNPDYPTIQELSDFIKSKTPDLDIVVQNDIIRITPRQ
jgi:hypothetical protein